MTTRNQVKVSEHVDSAWEQLASRAVRVVLTRRDVSYAQLAQGLAELGISESDRSIEGKVRRGTFRFTFFLQILTVSRSAVPEQWAGPLGRGLTWEARAASLLADELSAQPWLDWSNLSSRLGEIGVYIQPEALRAQVEDGSFAAALFFQCATVCRFPGMQLFLDQFDVNEAALIGAPQH